MTSLLKFGAKAAVAATAVYVTTETGVWGTASAHGSQAFNNLVSQVLPDANQYLNKVPSAKCVNEAAVGTWNSGVQKTFSALAAAPDTVCHYSHAGYEQIKKMFSS